MVDKVDDLVTKTSALKKRVAEQQRNAAVAAADEERLKKEVTTALAELKEKYECSSYDEAVKKRETLIEELSEAIKELEEQLDAIRNV